MMLIYNRFEPTGEYSDKGDELLYSRVDNVFCIKKELTYYDKPVFYYLKNNHNPHISNVYEYWEEDGTLYVIEEYVPGKTLEEYLREDHPEYSEKVRIMNEVFDGLEFLHNAPSKIIHRDLKESNIMIAKDGTVKIIDYDAAKVYKPGSERDTTLIGTEGSAAPEQYGFGQSDPRTDIYALGVLIRKVMDGDSDYSSIIAKATKLDPDMRYQNVDQLRKAFNSDKCPFYLKHGKLIAILIPAVTVLIVILCIVVIGIAAGKKDTATPVETISTTVSSVETVQTTEEQTVATPEATTTTQDKIRQLASYGNGINESTGYQCSYRQLFEQLKNDKGATDEEAAEAIDLMKVDFKFQAINYALASYTKTYDRHRQRMVDAGFTDEEIEYAFFDDNSPVKIQIRTDLSHEIRKKIEAGKFKKVSAIIKYYEGQGYPRDVILRAMDDLVYLREAIEAGKIKNDCTPTPTPGW